MGARARFCALGHLFELMGRTLGLEEKEGNALVNGSPCGAALLADGALAAAGRVAVAYEALALSVEAFAAPLEAYDRELAALWGDEGETTALQRLGTLLEGARERARPPSGSGQLPHPATCAWPSRASARRCATRRVNLALVDNRQSGLPAAHTRAPARARVQHRRLPQRHGAAHAACADGRLCRPLPLDRAPRRGALGGSGKRQPRPSRSSSVSANGDGGLGGGGRAAAQPPILPRSGPGQNDAGASAFLAWRRNAAAGPHSSRASRCCSQRQPRSSSPKGSGPLHRCATVSPRHAICPPTTRPYDTSAAALAAALNGEVYGSR